MKTMSKPFVSALCAVGGAFFAAEAEGMTWAARHNAAFTMPKSTCPYAELDPELSETFGNFAFGDIYEQTPDLDTLTRARVVLAALIATGSQEVYAAQLEGALDNRMSPIEVKEILYQAVPYLGNGKVLPFIRITNEILQKRGVELPLPKQGTTTRETRFDAGFAVQLEAFGERIRTNRETAPADLLHIQTDLSAHCFGDTYTRKGLDLKQRELITFVLLASFGGCDAQVRGHVAGNAQVGNDRKMLIQAITAVLPYIGYPRTLNAIAAINAVLPPEEQEETK